MARLDDERATDAPADAGSRGAIHRSSAGNATALEPRDVYAAGRPGNMSPAVRGFPDRIYVPNSGSNTVDVNRSAHLQDHQPFDVGKQPQHVVPSWI